MLLLRRVCAGPVSSDFKHHLRRIQGPHKVTPDNILRIETSLFSASGYLVVV